MVFFSACAGMTFFGISLITLGAVLPSLSAKFALDNLGVSTVVTFLPFGVLLGSLVFGPFVDRFGYKFLLILSSLVTASGLVWIGTSESLAAIRIAVFLTGFGGGILNGETNTIVSDISGDDRNSNLSFLAIFFGLGALGIPVLLGALSKHFSFETILPAAGALMALITVAFFFISFPSPKQAQGFPFREGFRLLGKPLLLLLSFVLFFESGMEGLTNNWTTTFLEKSRALSPGKALFALTMMVAGMTATRLLLGFVLKKVKSSIVIYAGLISIALGIVLVWSGVSHIAGVIFLGAGFAPVFPVVLGYIGTLYPDLSGTAFSIALFIALLGNTGLNFLMGVISDISGIQIFPVVLLIAVLMMSVLIVISLKNKSLTNKVK